MAPAQRGGTLIEVLVAILVSSVGLLGLAGMSLAAFSYNKTAQIRMTGVGLSNDYAERARMNVRGVDAGLYDIAQDVSAPDTLVVPTWSYLDTVGTTDAERSVAAAQVAEYDKNSFLTEVSRRLPKGRAVVQQSPGAKGTRERSLDVWLLWAEDDASTADSAAHKLFETGQRNCPNNLSEANKAIYNCMYFRIAL